MVKECPNHGSFEALLWRDACWYEEFGINALHGLLNAERSPCEGGCPNSCGLCNEHEGDTCIAVIELTSRCDKACPICFADAGSLENGDPSIQKVRGMIDAVASKRIVPTLQLSGGEPTLRSDLIDIVSYAKAKGIGHLMLNTNGQALADSASLADNLYDAGLDAVYLQFDSVCDDEIVQLRGEPQFSMKQRALEHCAQAGLGVVLVVTVCDGVNVGSLGDIIEFAKKWMPTVKGVHFQPAARFGRFELQVVANRAE